MNIKSLLLGSAAALAAVSGAQAADAIVAAEPEPLEYVRVCDAFGTGYFYIPGTETCLKISGYVRTQLDYRENGFGNDTDINSFTRGQLVFEAKNDTEFGALSSAIVINAETDEGTYLDAAWISIAGFDVGNYYTWWDTDLSGETDSLSSNDTSLNGIRYTYDGGTFQVGVAVEELEGASGLVYADGGNGNDDIGAGGLVGFSLGGVKATVIGNYDFSTEEAAFRALLTADIGPGTLGIAGIYATDPNYYWDVSEWTVAVEYKIQATDKLFITPAAQYFGDVRGLGGANFENVDAWRVGVTAGYQITEGLRGLATVNYTDADEAGTTVTGPTDSRWTGFVRLQRDF
jgi:hypothetical protein